MKKSFSFILLICLLQTFFSQERVLENNTIAVLPVPFLNTETQMSSQEMAKFAQNDIYQELTSELSHIKPLKVQDLRTTNSLLRKANLNYANIDEVEIEELQKILGVDYIITAKVQYITKNVETSNSSINLKDDKKGSQEKLSGSQISTKSSSLNYDYKIYLDLYKNSQKIYTKTREPFFKSQDSWIDALHYLLKRSPIYSK